MDLNKFDEPFSPEDIEWRIQQSGKTRDGKVWAMVLAYVTNRAPKRRHTGIAAARRAAKRRRRAKRCVTNGAIVIHTQRLKSDPGGNLLS